MLIAACYGHLGRIDEARAGWADLMKVNPAFSLAQRDVRTVWDADAIDTSYIGFRPIQKIATIHASSGFIRGIRTKAGAGLPGLIVVVRRRPVLVAPSSQRCSQVGLSLAPG